MKLRLGIVLVSVMIAAVGCGDDGATPAGGSGGTAGNGR